MGPAPPQLSSAGMSVSSMLAWTAATSEGRKTMQQCVVMTLN